MREPVICFNQKSESFTKNMQANFSQMCHWATLSCKSKLCAMPLEQKREGQRGLAVGYMLAKYLPQRGKSLKDMRRWPHLALSLLKQKIPALSSCHSDSTFPFSEAARSGASTAQLHFGIQTTISSFWSHLTWLYLDARHSFVSFATVIIHIHNMLVYKALSMKDLPSVFFSGSSQMEPRHST